MARHFKRRRGPKVSKNEQKVRRRQQDGGRASSLRESLPSVAKLTVHLQFLSPQGEMIRQEDRVLRPSDPCDLSASCPGPCGGVGSFNLEAKVQEVVETRQSVLECGGACQEDRYGSIQEPCGSRLKCRIEAEYADRPSDSTREV